MWYGCLGSFFWDCWARNVEIVYPDFSHELGMESCQDDLQVSESARWQYPVAIATPISHIVLNNLKALWGRKIQKFNEICYVYLLDGFTHYKPVFCDVEGGLKKLTDQKGRSFSNISGS